MTTLLRGNFPILATTWAGDGCFDPTSQARLIDWLIDSGVHGLVMAANASEGHAQSDAEKAEILEFSMKRVAGRVPVIVTVTHFAVEVATEKARKAEAMGAAGVMSMPQFFGNWGSDLPAAFAYYCTLAASVKIPVMVQDHPVSGVAMNAEFLTRLAREIENVSYFKLEFTQSPFKMARVLAQAGAAVRGMFGGESGIYFLEEYERGGRGTMPACYLPRVFSETFRLLEAGATKEAHAFFTPYVPLLNFELRMANRNLWKCILKHLGVIASDRVRGPMPAYWDAATQRQCLDHVARVDPSTFGVPVKSRLKSPAKPARKSARAAAGQ
ncbi:MAG: dihydrodipicolinate synthase family protein [Opitutaceae bacterium]|nr:dihydrodipicolinate synthase family protein [Opitutaceae bacterium]